MSERKIEKDKRSAIDSNLGYRYQYLYLEKFILENLKTDKYVSYENFEDISIKTSNELNLFQIKYTSDSESLTYSSGLWKVVVANYDKFIKNKIKKIVFIKGKKTKIKPYTFIVKIWEKYNTTEVKNFITYVILIILIKEIIRIYYGKKNYKGKKIFKKFEIMTKKYDGIKKIYDEEEIYELSSSEKIEKAITFIIDEFPKKIKLKNKTKVDKIRKEIQHMNFFWNNKNCHKYLESFTFIEGPSHDKLRNEIDELIVKKFKLNTKNKEINKGIIYMIDNRTIRKIDEKMFNNDTKFECKKFYLEIKKDIENMRNGNVSAILKEFCELMKSDNDHNSIIYGINIITSLLSSKRLLYYPTMQNDIKKIISKLYDKLEDYGEKSDELKELRKKINKLIITMYCVINYNLKESVTKKMFNHLGNLLTTIRGNKNSQEKFKNFLNILINKYVSIIKKLK